MRILSREIGIPTLLLIALAVAIAGATMFALSTSATAFGLYNPTWEGATELRSQTESVGGEGSFLLNSSTYQRLPPNQSVAIIISPDTPYGSDADLVEGYVRQGGTLVVLEDFGPHSNSLLRSIGANASLDGRILRDKRYYERSQNVTVIHNISSSQYTRGVDQLMINHGTAVHPNNATPVAISSNYSYLDGNTNGQLDASESLGPRPVVTIEDLGAGEVIVVGDPSLVINEMINRPGNQQFIKNILLSREQIYLDYSHASRIPVLSSILLKIRESGYLQAGLGIGLIAIFLVSWNYRAILDRFSSGPDSGDDIKVTADRQDLATYLKQKHPEWSEDRLDRVLRSLDSNR